MNNSTKIRILDLPEALAKRMRKFRKVKSVWARKLLRDQDVETLEGVEKASAGDFLCRGLNNELWPQSEKSLLAKYQATDVFDENRWQRFDPRLDTDPILAVQVQYSFQLNSERGAMVGKSGDYLVQSSSDPTDAWVVDQAIFEMTYMATDDK